MSKKTKQIKRPTIEDLENAPEGRGRSSINMDKLLELMRRTNKAYSLKEILAELGTTSHNYVRKLLDNLKDAGQVNKRFHGGRCWYYVTPT